ETNKRVRLFIDPVRRAKLLLTFHEDVALYQRAVSSALPSFPPLRPVPIHGGHESFYDLEPSRLVYGVGFGGVPKSGAGSGTVSGEPQSGDDEPGSGWRY
ncbi:MAG: hypothetical protein AAF517_18840, partial [Planctomycetota bacterium]